MKTAQITAIIVLFFHGVYYDNNHHAWQDAVLRYGAQYKIIPFRKSVAYGKDSAGTVIETKDSIGYDWQSESIDKGDFKIGETFIIDSVAWNSSLDLNFNNVLSELQMQKK